MAIKETGWMGVLSLEIKMSVEAHIEKNKNLAETAGRFAKLIETV